MKRKAITLGGVVLIMAAVTGFKLYFEPSRLTPAQAEAQERVEEQLASNDQGSDAKPEEAVEAAPAAAEETDSEGSEPAEAAEPEAAEESEDVGLAMDSLPEEAPDMFKVKFDTSKGDVVMQANKEWAPNGVQRFWELITSDFFTDVRFYRVVTQPRPFVVQFGISGDPAVSAKWRGSDIPDDPRVAENKRGFVSFAAAGPNTRTTQLFINLSDNGFLDTYAPPFAPIAEVIEGMDVVDSFNSQYQEQATQAQGMIQARGNAFLEENFPGLDYIKSVTVLETE